MIPIHMRKTRWVYEDTNNSTTNTNTEDKDNQLEDILNNLEGIDNEESEEPPNDCEYELIIFPLPLNNPGLFKGKGNRTT